MALKADFARQGPDLRIEGRDGEQVLVQDYFATEAPRDLILGDGAGVLKGSLVVALAGSATPGQYAQLETAALSSGAVGQVEAISGEAFAVRVDGTRVPLEVGSPIYMGDVLETSRDGALAVGFIDGTRFSLADDARMVIDELVYDPGSDANSASFSLVQGLFVLVSGDVAKTGEMEIETPSSTIGIRGTSAAFQLAADGLQQIITLLQDPNGIDGIVEVATQVATVILDVFGATTTVSSAGEPPSPIEILEGADIEALYQAALASMQAISDANLGVVTGDGGTGDDGSGDASAADPDAALDAFTAAVADLFEALADAIEDAEAETEEGDADEDGTDDSESAAAGDPDTTSELLASTETSGSTNVAPVASDDVAVATEDGSVNIVVLDNDSDPDGGTLTVTAASAPNGAVVVEIDGSLTYTPDTDFAGIDTISYTISDGSGGSDTGAGAVTIAAVNDAPVAVDDASATTEDNAVVIAVLGNDSDVDGDTLSVIGTTDGANGTVTTDGFSVTYTPDADFNGTDSFTYTISDGNGEVDSGTVTLAVGAVEDTPVAAADAATTDEDQAVVIAVLANDTDVDGDTLTVTAVTNGANGTATTDGTVLTYTPDADFNGTDTIMYTISDGNGGTDTAVVTVTIDDVNDPVLGAVVIAGLDGGVPEEDTELTADTSALTDADGLGVLSYQWQSSSDGGATWDDVGTDAATFTPGDAEVGLPLRVVVSYTDGEGTAESVESAAMAGVGNVNDPVLGAVVIAGLVGGVPEEDSELTADTSALTDADGLGVLSYQWQSSSDGGATWDDVGTDAATFTPGDAEVGLPLRVVVSYTDGEGTAESVESAATDPVANVNDAPVGVPIVSGEAAEDSVLTADTSGISDADGLGVFSFQWQAFNGEGWDDISGATEETFTPGDELWPEVGDGVKG